MTEDTPPIGPEPNDAVWPKGGDPTDEAVPVCCESCGLQWRVHPDMAGFRFRCRCGEWLQTPARESRSADIFLPVMGAPADKVVRHDETGGLIPKYQKPPDATHWDVTSRKRFTDGTLLQIGGILACFYLPHIVLALTFSPGETTVLLPIATLSSCILVFFIALLTPRSAFRGLVWPGPRPFLEAAGATLAFLGFAIILTSWLRSAFPDSPDVLKHMRNELGLVVALLTLSLAPGVFEELAFRGILQERMEAFFGRWQGILLTGVAFGLAHGMTGALPLQMGIGIYLCWLRSRCGSLLPGMALHMAYNGVLVAL